MWLRRSEALALELEGSELLGLGFYGQVCRVCGFKLFYGQFSGIYGQDWGFRDFRVGWGVSQVGVVVYGPRCFGLRAVTRLQGFGLELLRLPLRLGFRFTA